MVITTNIVAVTPQTQADEQIVRTAAAFGWALVELLGRCFTLPSDAPNIINWDADKLVMLPDTRTPREQIRALVSHMVYLADFLDVSSFTIEREGDPDIHRRYVDVQAEKVIALSEVSRDPAQAAQTQHICSQINERLFWWDEKIYDAFQNRPVVVYKAYMAGRGLASLRWYYGLQNNEFNTQFLQNLRDEYLRVMSPYLPPFMAGALSYSVTLWGNVLINDQVKPDKDGEVLQALQRQADLWYSLVTGTSDPLSYINTSKVGSQFFWRVARLFWPLILASAVVLAVIIGILVVVILRNPNIIVTSVGSAAGLLALLGTYHSIASNVGGVLQKAASKAAGELQGSFVDSLWNSSQQKEVNQAMCVPIPTAGLSKTDKSRRVAI